MAQRHTCFYFIYRKPNDFTSKITSQKKNPKTCAFTTVTLYAELLNIFVTRWNLFWLRGDENQILHW